MVAGDGCLTPKTTSYHVPTHTQKQTQPPGMEHSDCSTDAMCPNVALALWDNYQQKPNKAFLKETFPKLERYVVSYRGTHSLDVVCICETRRKPPLPNA